MLSASLVTRWRAPRVKGLRAALVLAKAACFAVLDRAATPPFDTAPHRAKGLAIKKACCFLWRYSPCSQEREDPEQTSGGKSMNTEQSIPAEQKTTAQELIAANI